MAKNRRQIFVKGLGNLSVRETDPSAAASFTDMGFLGNTLLDDHYEMEEIIDEAGNFIDVKEKGQRVSVDSSLLQSDKVAIDIMKDAAGKIHAVRYFGQETANSFKWFALDQCRIIPGVKMEFKPGTRSIPFMVKALKQGELSYDVPLYHLIETGGPMYLNSLKLWVSPRNGSNSETDKLLDASGHARHGTLNSDYATIWQQTTTPAQFLRGDGVNDAVDFGDILNDDGTSDFIIEGWVRVQASDATAQEILTKKSAISGNTAGFSIYRSGANKLTFVLASGSANAPASTTTSVLQNVWTHFLIAVDRNGNATWYVNGVVEAGPVSVAAIGTGTNALSLYLGRDATNFGQVDLGDIRIYNYGAGGLPTAVTIALAHYNAEKALYGL